MKLSRNEIRLLARISDQILSDKITDVTRNTEKEYDLSVHGTTDSGGFWSSSLPLQALKWLFPIEALRLLPGKAGECGEDVWKLFNELVVEDDHLRV